MILHGAPQDGISVITISYYQPEGGSIFIYKNAVVNTNMDRGRQHSAGMAMGMGLMRVMRRGMHMGATKPMMMAMSTPGGLPPNGFRTADGAKEATGLTGISVDEQARATLIGTAAERSARSLGLGLGLGLGWLAVVRSGVARGAWCW
jgi:hypothetical protein